MLQVWIDMQYNPPREGTSTSGRERVRPDNTPAMPYNAPSEALTYSTPLSLRSEDLVARM